MSDGTFYLVYAVRKLCEPLMPAVKFNFLRKKNVGLYSKAALGVTYRTEYIDYDDGSKDYDEKDFHVNWHLSFIGVEVGGPYLRGFTELGIGEQGIVCAGLRYKKKKT